MNWKSFCVWSNSCFPLIRPAIKKNNLWIWRGHLRGPGGAPVDQPNSSWWLHTRLHHDPDRNPSEAQFFSEKRGHQKHQNRKMVLDELDFPTFPLNFHFQVRSVLLVSGRVSLAPIEVVMYLGVWCIPGASRSSAINIYPKGKWWENPLGWWKPSPCWNALKTGMGIYRYTQ